MQQTHHVYVRVLCFVKERSIYLWLILLAFMIVISLSLGRFPVSFTDIIGLFESKTNNNRAIISNLLLNIRLPRVIASIAIGAALATSGATFQGLFVNPLVSPSLLGVLAGASFGAAMGMILSCTLIQIQILAFIFGNIAVLLGIILVRNHKNQSRVTLVLGGIISGAFFTALLSIIKYTADPNNQLPTIVYFLMGSLAQVNLKTSIIASIGIIIGITGLIAHGRVLNALSMGEDEAHCLGINIHVSRYTIIAFATLASALTVVLGGVIGWVGLIVPHMVRMLYGPDNTRLLPTSAIVGAIYLLALDDISRTVFSVEIPIGILTSLLGIPCFAILINRSRFGW